MNFLTSLCFSMAVILASGVIEVPAYAEGGSIGGSIGKRDKSASGGQEAEAPRKARVIDRIKRRKARNEVRGSARRPAQPGQHAPGGFQQGSDGFRHDPVFGVRMPRDPLVGLR